MRAALFTIDPLGRGGAFTSLQAVYAMLSEWRIEPRLIYLNAGIGEGLTPRELLRSMRFWSARHQVRRGLSGLAVGHLAAGVPALAYQWWPYPTVRQLLDSCQMYLVLGVPLCGISAAILGKRYVCWTATLLEDELRARADGGEAWAQRVLGSPLWPLMVWQERLVLRKAARILAVSQHTAERIRETVPTAADRLEVLSWPIDTERFAPTGERRDSLARRVPRLVTVGRLDDPRKNVGALLEALPLVQAEVGPVELRLIGPGSESLTSRLPEGALSLGRLSDEDLVRELQDADLFVLPSLQEGLGLVVLEAMACGLPVVCTPSGGPDAHVRSGQTGFVTRGFGARDISESIVLALRDDAELLRMGQTARTIMVKENGRVPVAERLRATLESVYGEALGVAESA